MRFINLKTMTEVSSISNSSVLCLGNFDGVHLGHRQLVDAVLFKQNTLKKTYPNLVSGAWFFDSNFYKNTDEIYSLSEKLEVFASLGLEYAIIADFNEMKSLSPEDFVNEILQNQCKCIHAVCGDNFRFGAKAAGSSQSLSDLMSGKATVVPLMAVSDDVSSNEKTIISSTYIRTLLMHGDISKANSLLGKNYSICETVVHGKALGRKLGIPTINQNVQEKRLILKNGIYATLCTIDGKLYQGVTNVGIRPTVDNNGIQNIETHIIDFDGDCYEKKVKIEFLSRIRDEMKFDSVDALKDQIQKDIRETIHYFNK